MGMANEFARGASYSAGGVVGTAGAAALAVLGAKYVSQWAADQNDPEKRYADIGVEFQNQVAGDFNVLGQGYALAPMARPWPDPAGRQETLKADTRRSWALCIGIPVGVALLAGIVLGGLGLSGAMGNPGGTDGEGAAALAVVMFVIVGPLLTIAGAILGWVRSKQLKHQAVIDTANGVALEYWAVRENLVAAFAQGTGAVTPSDAARALSQTTLVSSLFPQKSIGWFQAGATSRRQLP